MESTKNGIPVTLMYKPSAGEDPFVVPVGALKLNGCSPDDVLNAIYDLLNCGADGSANGVRNENVGAIGISYLNKSRVWPEDGEKDFEKKEGITVFPLKNMADGGYKFSDLLSLFRSLAENQDSRYTFSTIVNK